MSKVALITGAYKGLGFETARQLGQQGYTVIVSARDLAKAEESAQKLRDEGIDAAPLKLEVTSEADQAAAAKFIEEKYGKLDVLVNNAGVLLDQNLRENHTSETTTDMLRKTFEANLFAPVALTIALLPLLRKCEAGRIVNLSSILGSLTLQSDPKSPIYEGKTFAYNASKAALNMFTIHLAHELKGTNIKVNSAHPGWVKTDMGTSAATMEIEDGAKTSVGLATIGADGPNGTYSHMGKPLPW